MAKAKWTLVILDDWKSYKVGGTGYACDFRGVNQPAAGERMDQIKLDLLATGKWEVIDLRGTGGEWTAWYFHAGCPMALISVVATSEEEAREAVFIQLSLHKGRGSYRNQRLRDWSADGQIVLPKGIRPDLVVELPIKTEEVEHGTT